MLDDKRGPDTVPAFFFPLSAADDAHTKTIRLNLTFPIRILIKPAIVGIGAMRHVAECCVDHAELLYEDSNRKNRIRSDFFVGVA